MSLVAGVDTSTQSCKVIIRDTQTGTLVRQGKAAHPAGTEIDPNEWWIAFNKAADAAGGMDDVSAISVGGQQHGMVVLDADGEIVRPALLWNDTRSADDAEQLITEAGNGDRASGAKFWAEACGSVLVASLTITKLHWLVTHEPDNAKRVAAVCLPHDWLSWRLAGHGPKSQGGDGDLSALFTDRSDASGTGYWSPFSNDYRTDLLEMAFGAVPLLPKVLAPNQIGGTTPTGAVIGAGAGDNAAAALGLGIETSDVVISIGTSAVVSAISAQPLSDPSGLVTGFADATGQYLPLACTLNGARVLDATAKILGTSYTDFDSLALAAPPGCDGLVMVPYLEGERTPNKPHARGALHGMSLANMTPEHIARAGVEGLCCLLADGLDAMAQLNMPLHKVFLIGGAAKNGALRQIAPAVFGRDITVPAAGEYVADGAARQAAWALSGDPYPPLWVAEGTKTFSAEPQPIIRQQYARVRELTFPNN